MATNRAPLLAFSALAAASISAVLACSSGPQKKEPVMTVEEYERNTPEPGPWEDPCTDDQGEPLECSSDDDCCEGYSCLEDPGRSRVLKYCQQI